MNLVIAFVEVKSVELVEEMTKGIPWKSDRYLAPLLDFHGEEALKCG